MTYEKPELVLVDAAGAIVLGGINGQGDADGTFPNQLVTGEFGLGLDD